MSNTEVFPIIFENQTSDYLLVANNIKKYFPAKGHLLKNKSGSVKAVDDVSFAIKKGETFGLVGESGCGKSTLGRVIMKLYQPTSGSIMFEGQDITEMNGNPLRKLRKDFQMVFQDPYSSLNPRLKINAILEEALIVNKQGSRKEIKERVASLLEVVGLGPEAGVKYPHEFSGGQRQRIAIARALALQPKLIVLDEAVSALDVSIQAQIINLLTDLKKEFGLSYLFISHDLAVVKHVSDRLGVMYLGRMVEIGTKESIYHTPYHPYTQSLLSAAPIAKRGVKRERIILEGDVPSPLNPPSGCPFHTRCPKAFHLCSQQRPDFKEIESDHFVACHL